MKVVLLTTDNREHKRLYHLDTPFFGTAPEALLQGMAKIKDVELHVVSCTQRRMSSPDKLAPHIFFHSLHVPKIGWMRTGYQGCIRAVRRHLKILQPDIVHGQGTERDCAISAVYSGFPNVITIHGNMAELARHFGSSIGSFHWLAGKLENFTLPRTLGVFCNSEYTERLVRPRNPRNWRVPNAIRDSFFDRPLRETNSQGKLINIGVVTPRKRQVEIAQLASQLKEAGLSLEMEFIGPRDPQDEYGLKFQRVMEDTLIQGIRHAGAKSTDEVIDALDSASGMVHFPTEESFGLVVAEALSRNLKLFAARVGGITEIAEGVDGVELFDPEDWGGLRQGVTKWIAAGSPRPRHAAEQMKNRYHPVVVAQRHLEIYRGLLKTSS